MRRSVGPGSEVTMTAMKRQMLEIAVGFSRLLSVISAQPDPLTVTEVNAVT